jgi:hypothetical protein
MIESLLTTVDNPFDPFLDYDSWYQWDSRYGYHTPEFLARIAKVSVETSEADQALAIEDAIDEIVKENVTGMYRKVTRELPD